MQYNLTALTLNSIEAQNTKAFLERSLNTLLNTNDNLNDFDEDIEKLRTAIKVQKDKINELHRIRVRLTNFNEV